MLDDSGRRRIAEQLRELLNRNTREGYSPLLDRHYCFIAPSPGTYPFQWFWDTCFHVVMLVRLGQHELAKRHLRSLFQMQEDDGFVGHMVFWHQLLPRRPSDVLQARPARRSLRPHMSALIQPTFLAQVLLQLFEACGDRVYLGELYAKVRAYHEWLAANRDFDGDGLITIISPFESGMDWKASYDPVVGYRARRTPTRLLTSELYWRVMRVDFGNFAAGYDLGRIRERGRFLVKDAGVNAIYAADLAAMERLAALIGDDPEHFARRRRRVVDSMMRLMYDPGAKAFLDVQEPGSRQLPALTSTIFFPLAVEGIDDSIARDIVDAHLRNGDGFSVPWPLPSVDRHDPAFHAGETPFLWRGPAWAFINWFVFRGLKKRGMDREAQRLRDSLWGLVERSGFREYYDPFTGKGLGAREFTWSGLVLDMP